MKEANLVVGMDLGKVSDHTAIAVVEHLWKIEEDRPPTDIYRIGFVHRWPLETPYEAIISDLGAIIEEGGFRGAPIIFDASGIGRTVAKLLHDAHLRRELGDYMPQPIIITGAAKMVRNQVPLADLIAAVVAPMQTGRLKLAAGLPDGEALLRELLTFHTKTTPTGNLSYGSERQRDHDDLVMAVALAVWFRHTRVRPRRIEEEALKIAM